MPVYDLLHVQDQFPDDAVGGFDPEPQPPARRTVGRLRAASLSAARKAGVVRWPAPEGWHTIPQEMPASRMLRRWQDAGDAAFAGQEDEYDALVLALDEDLMDDAHWPLTFAALCDLADDCGADPRAGAIRLVPQTRTLCIR